MHDILMRGPAGAAGSCSTFSRLETPPWRLSKRPGKTYVFLKTAKGNPQKGLEYHSHLAFMLPAKS